MRKRFFAIIILFGMVMRLFPISVYANTIDDNDDFETIKFSANVGDATDNAEVTEPLGNDCTAENTEDITLSIIENGEAVNSSGSCKDEITAETTGSLKEDDAENYDQTTTVTNPNRSASASASISTEVSSIETNENGAPIIPENEEGYVYYVKEYWDIDNENNNGNSVSDKLIYWKIVKPVTDDDGTDATEEVTNIIEYLNNNHMSYWNNHAGTYNIVLGRQDGSKLIGGLYCVDWSTDTVDDIGYRIASLEEAAEEGYYNIEQVDHLRAIIKNGYDWSVDSSEDVPGTESLGRFKQMLTNALINGEIEGITKNDIENLSRNDAAVITQVALWTYANRIELKENEKLEIFVADDSRGIINDTLTVMARYLASLKDDGSSDKQTTPYSKNNFVDSMKIVIGSMVKDEINNADDNDDNDVYNVNLKFSLKVIPGLNDDLVIQLLDSNGNVIKVARIAGNDDETNFGYAKTETDDDGKVYYLLDGLKLQENSDFTFSLKLTGAQYLEEGVYVFESRKTEYGESGSQNLIGRYEGYMEVDVASNIILNFNVRETDCEMNRTYFPADPGSSDDGLDLSTDYTSNGSPRTGDESRVALLCVLACMSLTCMAALAFIRKQRHSR